VDVRRFDHPVPFLALVTPLLGSDPIAEARHNLLFGIASTLRDTPSLYPAFHLWAVLEHERPVGAALMTLPYNLVLADPTRDEALASIVDAVLADAPTVPGLVGNEPAVHAFARRWTRTTGSRAEVVLRQGVFALTDVLEVPRASGGPRRADERDRELLHVWVEAFASEALPEEHRAAEPVRASVDARLGSPTAGFWLWEDAGQTVSLTGYGGPTPTGIRLGPVYTPPEHRRRGYGTSLVAHASRELLGAGFRACFLYTDLSNPTSNAIYGRIGYEKVCTAVEYRFMP
jgi:hypothetical protein